MKKYIRIHTGIFIIRIRSGNSYKNTHWEKARRIHMGEMFVNSNVVLILWICDVWYQFCWFLQVWRWEIIHHLLQIKSYLSLVVWFSRQKKTCFVSGYLWHCAFWNSNTNTHTYGGVQVRIHVISIFMSSCGCPIVN